MSRIFQLLGAGILALAVAAPAGAAPAQKAKTAKQPAAHSITGTLDKYDAAGNAIIVKTAKGDETLSLASATSIRMGATRMTSADLSGHTGQRVKVRYTDENGKQVAQTVQFEGGTKTARAETSAKSPAKK